MRLISQRPLKIFWEEHRDAERSLKHWVTAVETSTWNTLADVRKLFANADPYKKFTIFNIAGNKYRLIVVIHFNTKRVYVRHILTHSEYDRGKWKDD